MVHRRSTWLNRNRLNELLTRELRTVLGWVVFVKLCKRVVMGEIYAALRN